MVAQEPDATEPLTLIELDEFRRGSAVTPPPPWSMVSIRNLQKLYRDSPPIVFPPIDHENLHISPSPYQIHSIHAGHIQIPSSDSESDSDFNSSSTFSPSDSSPPLRSPIYPAKAEATDATGWFGWWKEILNCKVYVLVRNLVSAFTSSLLTCRSSALVAFLVAFLYFRRRRRLRGGESSRDRLIGMIHKRDEKISELLNQISGMNEMMLAVAAKKSSTI